MRQAVHEAPGRDGPRVDAASRRWLGLSARGQQFERLSGSGGEIREGRAPSQQRAEHQAEQPGIGEREFDIGASHAGEAGRTAKGCLQRPTEFMKAFRSHRGEQRVLVREVAIGGGGGNPGAARGLAQADGVSAAGVEQRARLRNQDRAEVPVVVGRGS